MKASSEQDLDQKNSDRLAFPVVLTNAGIMPRNNWRGRRRRGDLFWPFPIELKDPEERFEEFCEGISVRTSGGDLA